MRVAYYSALGLAAIIVLWHGSSQLRKVSNLSSGGGQNKTSPSSWSSSPCRPLGILETFGKITGNPVLIDSLSFVLNDVILAGNFNFREIKISGLPPIASLTNPSNTSSFFLAISLDNLAVTGHYQFTDGHLNLTSCGSHTFVGSGLLDIPSSSVQIRMQVTAKVDPLTSLVSVVDFDFLEEPILPKNIKLENLQMDMEPVDWERVSDNLVAGLDTGDDDTENRIFDVLNFMLSNCTLEDVTQLVSN